MTTEAQRRARAKYYQKNAERLRAADRALYRAKLGGYTKRELKALRRAQMLENSAHDERRPSGDFGVREDIAVPGNGRQIGRSRVAAIDVRDEGVATFVAPVAHAAPHRIG